MLYSAPKSSDAEMQVNVVIWLQMRLSASLPVVQWKLMRRHNWIIVIRMDSMHYPRKSSISYPQWIETPNVCTEQDCRESYRLWTLTMSFGAAYFESRMCSYKVYVLKFGPQYIPPQ
jgi:hypothetical protein